MITGSDIDAALGSVADETPFPDWAARAGFDVDELVERLMIGCQNSAEQAGLPPIEPVVHAVSHAVLHAFVLGFEVANRRVPDADMPSIDNVLDDDPDAE